MGDPLDDILTLPMPKAGNPLDDILNLGKQPDNAALERDRYDFQKQAAAEDEQRRYGGPTQLQEQQIQQPPGGAVGTPRAVTLLMPSDQQAQAREEMDRQMVENASAGRVMANIPAIARPFAAGLGEVGASMLSPFSKTMERVGTAIGETAPKDVVSRIEAGAAGAIPLVAGGEVAGLGKLGMGALFALQAHLQTRDTVNNIDTKLQAAGNKPLSFAQKGAAYAAGDVIAAVSGSLLKKVGLEPGRALTAATWSALVKAEAGNLAKGATGQFVLGAMQRAVNKLDGIDPNTSITHQDLQGLLVDAGIGVAFAGYHAATSAAHGPAGMEQIPPEEAAAELRKPQPMTPEETAAAFEQLKAQRDQRGRVRYTEAELQAGLTEALLNPLQPPPTRNPATWQPPEPTRPYTPPPSAPTEYDLNKATIEPAAPPERITPEQAYEQTRAKLLPPGKPYTFRQIANAEVKAKQAAIAAAVMNKDRPEPVGDQKQAIPEPVDAKSAVEAPTVAPSGENAPQAQETPLPVVPEQPKPPEAPQTQGKGKPDVIEDGDFIGTMQPNGGRKWTRKPSEPAAGAAAIPPDLIRGQDLPSPIVGRKLVRPADIAEQSKPKEFVTPTEKAAAPVTRGVGAIIKKASAPAARTPEEIRADLDAERARYRQELLDSNLPATQIKGRLDEGNQRMQALRTELDATAREAYSVPKAYPAKKSGGIGIVAPEFQHAEEVLSAGKNIGKGIGEIATDAIQQARRPVSYFFEKPYERMRAVGGTFGETMADTYAKPVIERTKKLINSLEPTVDPAIKALGRMNAATKYLNERVVRGTGKTGEWAVHRSLLALEEPLENVPAPYRPEAEIFRTANKALGTLPAEQINKQRQNAAKPGEAVEKYQASGKMQRLPSAELIDIVAQGTDSAAYKLIREATAKEAKITEAQVEQLFAEWRADLNSEKPSGFIRHIGPEYERVFEKVPTSIRLGEGHFGKWIDLFEARPVEYLKAAQRRNSAVTAVKEIFSEGARKQGEKNPYIDPDERIRELYGIALGKGGHVAGEYRNLLNTLHFRPTDMGKRVFDPGGAVAQHLVKPLESLISNVKIPLAMSQAAVGNVLEPLLLPFNFTAKDTAHLLQNLPEIRAKIHTTGATDPAHYNWSIDPGKPVESGLRLFRNAATLAGGNRFLNEMTERLGAMYHEARAQRMENGALSRGGLYTHGERLNYIEDLVNTGFKRPDAERMVDGNGTQAEYDAYRVRGPALKTGGNLHPAEASNFLNNRRLSGNFPFMNYPVTQGRITAGKVARFYEAVQARDGARSVNAFKELAVNVGGKAMVGGALNFAFAALRGDIEGEWGALQDEPGKYALEAWLKGMGGPLSIAYNLYSGPGNYSEKVLSTVSGFRGGAIVDAGNALFARMGKYHNLDTGDALLKYAADMAPAYKTLTTAASAMGLASMWPRIVTARSRYNSAYPQGGSSSKPTDDFGIETEKLHKLIANKAGPAEIAGAIDAIVKTLDPKERDAESVAKSIEGRMVLGDNHDPAEVKRKIGVVNYYLLRRHDDALYAWARAIRRPDEKLMNDGEVGPARLKTMSLENAKRAWDAATPDEQKAWQPAWEHKLAALGERLAAMPKDDATPEQRRNYQAEVKRAMQEFKQIRLERKDVAAAWNKLKDKQEEKTGKSSPNRDEEEELLIKRMNYAGTTAALAR